MYGKTKTKTAYLNLVFLELIKLGEIKNLPKSSKKCVCVCQSFSRVQIFASPCTVACQIPLSMDFSRQEYWSGQPFPYPGDLPDLGTELVSPALQAGSLSSEPQKKTNVCYLINVFNA